ncbi:MAG: NAD-dependent epimerase/dehydratase family protein [Deltaproteobacteria bacterium]|nr:NAD-dependent epimerase/dehydratase family protein [Deltaproteobacteria bacterium]
MKTAFVTGAAGFLGVNLAAVLREAGWRVVAVHRPASRLSRLRALGVELLPGDLHDQASLERAMPDGADAVFHVAGNTSVWSGNDAVQTRDNVDGTRHVAAAALVRGARRLVHTSSVAVFGLGAGRVDDETPPAESCWVNYYRTKRLAEREVEEAAARGLPTVVLRPGNIIGPEDRTTWVQLVRLVAQGRLPGTPPGRASWCHVREVARAHLAAAERGRPGSAYGLSCVEASYAEFVASVAAATGGRAPPVLPAVALRAYARLLALGSALTRRQPAVTPEGVAATCNRITMDSSRAQRELGYQPATLQQMVADCVAWLRSEGLLPGEAGHRP